MNNSNESLRFSRSYYEATGKPLHSRDFYEPEPLITGKEAVFWVAAVVVVGIIIYILKGF